MLNVIMERLHDQTVARMVEMFRACETAKDIASYNLPLHWKFFCLKYPAGGLPTAIYHNVVQHNVVRKSCLGCFSRMDRLSDRVGLYDSRPTCGIFCQMGATISAVSC